MVSPMKLFLVAGETHVMNVDLFVNAETPEAAFAEMLRYFNIEHEDIDGYVKVYEVPAPGAPGPVKWVDIPQIAIDL